MSKRIIINARVGRSQIKDLGNKWVVQGIPVTVDNAKMNGITYRAEDNRAGLDTIIDKPVTGGHPKKDGRNISANEARRDFYLGGDVINRYNADGVNYVDVEFNKNMMKANEKYGEYFHNKLEKREAFGVSTGLTLVPVTNGEETYATNQNYDHLAFLHDNEPPAGGNDTVARFNSESDADEVMVVNIDELLPEQRLFDKVLSMFNAMFGKDPETRYNQCDGETIADNSQNTGDEMTITKDEMVAAMSEALAINADKDKAVIDALNSKIDEMATNMKDMKEKLDAKEKAKLSAEEEEKAKLAKAVGNALKVSETFFANASIEELRALHADKCGTITGNAFGGGFTANSNDDAFGTSKMQGE